jgi:hypothetical protein
LLAPPPPIVLEPAALLSPALPAVGDPLPPAPPALLPPGPTGSGVPSLPPHATSKGRITATQLVRRFSMFDLNLPA